MMKKLVIIVPIIIIGLIMAFINDPKKDKSIILKGEKVEKVADGFRFTEGPAVDVVGNVFFTDQPNNRIMKWSVDGEVSVFMENAGRSNGLYFDRNGKLLACADMENELWEIDMDGNHQVLIDSYEGKRLNGPNDLWVNTNNGVYFTDPLYKRPYWQRDPDMQQDGEHVYYLSPDRKSLVRVATDLVKPNGIIGTPDGKTLYVADIGANKTYVYNIESDGKLSNKRLFAELGSDGMTIDNKGNVYLTGHGVTIFDRKGRQIEKIDIDANWTANICFGGENMNILFITASEYLYSVKTNVRGVR